MDLRGVAKLALFNVKILIICLILKKALAALIKYKIAIINLNSIHSDDHLSHRLGDVPERSLVLLEDIDAVFTDRTSV